MPKDLQPTIGRRNRGQASRPSRLPPAHSTFIETAKRESSTTRSLVHLSTVATSKSSVKSQSAGWGNIQSVPTRLLIQNTMNITKLALVTAIATISSAANSGGFDGPFVQAGVGFSNAKSEVHFTNWFNTKTRDDNLNGQIAGGYSRSFGQFNLAVSAHYIIGDQKAGKTTQQFDPSEIDNVNMKLKRQWGISIEPGFNFSESTLGYLKFGYSQAKGTWLFERPKFQDSHSGSPRFDGFSFGVGAKHKFTQNFYGFAEIQKTSFRRKDVSMTIDGNSYTDSFKPESLTGFIGVGYKF